MRVIVVPAPQDGSPRPARHRRRSAVILVDCLMACLFVGFLGAGILGQLTDTTRDSRSLRDDVLMRQLAMDLLDRQVAGAAREVITQGTPSGADGSFARDLSRSEWEALLPVEQLPTLAPLSPVITLTVKPVLEPVPGQRIGLALITCAMVWQDPVRGGKQLTLATVTDAL